MVLVVVAAIVFLTRPCEQYLWNRLLGGSSSDGCAEEAVRAFMALDRRGGRALGVTSLGELLESDELGVRVTSAHVLYRVVCPGDQKILHRLFAGTRDEAYD